MRTAFLTATVWCSTLFLATSAGAESVADSPNANSVGAGLPNYRIYPLLDGHCRVRGDHAFVGGSKDEVYDYALYIWLILGGDKPILVDAGITDIVEMNRGAAKVLYEPITKRIGENARDQIRKFGLTPDDIGHVFITHLHFDHVDDLLTYRNAKVYMGRKEWELASHAAPSWGHVRILEAFRDDPQWKSHLVELDDQQVFPGFESFWVGGHTPGSTAYRVHTKDGWAVLTGDTVSLLANIERDVPPGVFVSTDDCMAAMKKIREKADIVLPSHDPGTVKRWPPNPKKAPRFTIRAIKVGDCQVRDNITFQGGDESKLSTYYLYVWVIEGDDGQLLVVETGPKHPEEFSKGTAAYIPGGIKQLPEERTPEALRRNGIDPARVTHVIATHLHADHYDYFDAFPNAKFVVNRQEYEQGKKKLAADVKAALEKRPEALQLVEDEDIVPGVHVFPLGCHTAGSQGVVVDTHMGPAVLTGDVVYKYENIEQHKPAQSPDQKACAAAVDRIRAMADIVLPSHDPLTLERWPDGLIGAQPPTGDDRIPIPSFTLIASDKPSQPLRYALDQLADVFKRSASVEPSKDKVQFLLLVGRQTAEGNAPWLCQRIKWDDLGNEGFVLRMGSRGGVPVLVAAGATDVGTRQAIYQVIRELDLSKLPPSLPAGLDRIEKPSFDLRGMYAHQHWAYSYPYALRTWKVDEWKAYVDTLALMRVNLFQIWSMAGSLPVPFSPEDEAWLRRYPPVIDHAKQNHGMEVWIGECGNNMVDPARRAEMPPVPERDYFKFEALKNPADPAQMEELRQHRAEFYKVCNNADGYWVIDSDPGGWKGSPSNEFVDILMMNRELINQQTQLGPKAKLIYWMWFGWGTGKKPEDNWRSTLPDLVKRNPEPWVLTAADKWHWKTVDDLGLGLEARSVYYPYGAVEPEPSLPFTVVVAEKVQRVLKEAPQRVGKIRGIMGNAQTPVCQWPNIYYFERASWNIDLRAEPAPPSVRELARLIYPEQADLLAKAWLSLGTEAAPDADALADQLDKLERDKQLGRPGPVGLKLFPDYGQVARDLAPQLRIHSAAMQFCQMVDKGKASDEELLEPLKRYCLLSLAWRKNTGYNKHGTNGYDWFPVHDAAHKRWWKDNRFDQKVYDALAKGMYEGYEEWEAKLILDPLSK